MDAEWKIAYRIMGFDVPPEEMSAQVGVQPTTVWTRGAKRHPKTTLIHEENGWELAAPPKQGASLADQLDALCSVLWPVRTRLAALSPMWTKQIHCAMSVYDNECPELHIDKQLLRVIADLDAALNIDLVIYPGESESVLLCQKGS